MRGTFNKVSILLLVLFLDILLICACSRQLDESDIGQASDAFNSTEQYAQLPDDPKEDAKEIVNNIYIEPDNIILPDDNFAGEANTQPSDIEMNITQEIVSPESTEGGEAMSERLITEDELLEYIQTHDVGLSIEDFDQINIEDFILSRHLTPLSVSNLWKKTLENYLIDLARNERAKYMAQEKYSVESTNEVYECFINDFFLAINKDVVNKAVVLGFNRYDINRDSDAADTIILYIAQTKNINELNVYRNEKSTTPELLEVFIANGPDGAGVSGNFCYSKNKKYMLLANLYDEVLFEYVKALCTIND